MFRYITNRLGAAFQNVPYNIYTWANVYQIDLAAMAPEISAHAAKFETLLKSVTLDVKNDPSLNLKIFKCLLEIASSNSIDETRTIPYREVYGFCRGGKQTVLKRINKKVKVSSIHSAIEKYNSYGNPDDSYLISKELLKQLKDKIANTNTEEKVFLNEKQLDLLIKLLFIPIHDPEGQQVLEANDIEENNESDDEDDITVENEKYSIVPQDIFDLCIDIFGKQKTAALVKIRNKSDEDLIVNDPSIANSILTLSPKHAVAFASALIEVGLDDGLEIKLNAIYNEIRISTSESFEKFIYVLSWPFKNGISLSCIAQENVKKLLVYKKYLEHFPKFELSKARYLNEREADYFRNQGLFDLIIDHLKTLHELNQLQNQLVAKTVNDVVNLGNDITALINSYSGLAVHGVFANNVLSQMPSKKEKINLQEAMNTLVLRSKL